MAAQERRWTWAPKSTGRATPDDCAATEMMQPSPG